MKASAFEVGGTAYFTVHIRSSRLIGCTFLHFNIGYLEKCFLSCHGDTSLEEVLNIISAETHYKVGPPEELFRIYDFQNKELQTFCNVFTCCYETGLGCL